MSKPRRSPTSGRIDDYVGARIRERRISLGLSQQHLAKTIGITYQQTHMYEHGANRVSAGRLYEIARALDVPVSYFYEGVGDENSSELAPHQRSILEVASNFAAIENEKHQAALSEIARVLAGHSAPGAGIQNSRRRRGPGGLAAR
jgi:transcriptional regulator with XRE-family HTH domain